MILEHYFSALHGGAEQLGSLTLLEVERDDAYPLRPAAWHAHHADKPRAFLASVTYPTDLVMIAPGRADDRVYCTSDTSAVAERWWILGRTQAPTEWARRIIDERHAHAHDHGVNLMPLRAQVRAMAACQFDSKRQATK